MAKASAVDKNLKRKCLVEKYKDIRTKLKLIIHNKNSTMDERFAAVLKLAKLPRNSSPVRVRNRCQITGKPRGFYRKFKMSRIALRELGAQGVLPGVRKASW
jgi:small subunit ribosomal protein S14